MPWEYPGPPTIGSSSRKESLAPVKPGPKPRERNPLEGRVKELEKEKRALERKLKHAEWLLDISKKGAELMEKMALGPQFENDDSE